MRCASFGLLEPNLEQGHPRISGASLRRPSQKSAFAPIVRTKGGLAARPPIGTFLREKIMPPGL